MNNHKTSKQDDARLAEYPFDTKPSDASENGGEPNQDDARDSTVGAAVNTCAVCGERKATPLRIDSLGGYVCLSCALASARADGIREGLEQAAKVADSLADAQRLTNEAHPEHVKAYPAWEAYEAKFRQAAAAIRALINKDAGGK